MLSALLQISGQPRAPRSTKTHAYGVLAQHYVPALVPREQSDKQIVLLVAAVFLS